MSINTINSSYIKLCIKISYIYLNLIIFNSKYISDFDIQYDIMKLLEYVSTRDKKAIDSYHMIYRLVLKL